MGFNLKMLVDFEETTMKPLFQNRQGYYLRNPMGPFLINAEDVRDSIDVSH